ncbi:SDR family oxidoreductase [Phreatobacter stygius]|uniref:SDR family oxidoreductase n=1 Tax=Phreatobacter stygius TaxID=1940610 RepID=A0A4D7B5J4_9HYPH|nr:SDR family oxidoreductase [Phreatobacter stygius]QCI66415.1 SDR family oxidoreductase [Phreatobacter stygius]
MTVLKGRTALITDADKTIGRAIAEALAASGANVLIQGTDPASAKAAAAEISTRHRVFGQGLGANLADAGSIASAVAAAERPVDILVHTSCPQHLAPVEEFPDAAFEHILNVGLTSYFRLAKAVLPGMRARGWGRLLVMSSVQGLVASVDKSAYVAAKHGLVGFSKALALETAGSGVTANAFCPGWTGTEGTRAQAATIGAKLGISADQALQQMLVEKQPSKQFIKVEALGALVVFLCSPAGDPITGVALPVDGGWVAQ